MITDEVWPMFLLFWNVFSALEELQEFNLASVQLTLCRMAAVTSFLVKIIFCFCPLSLEANFSEIKNF